MKRGRPPKVKDQPAKISGEEIEVVRKVLTKESEKFKSKHFGKIELVKFARQQGMSVKASMRKAGYKESYVVQGTKSKDLRQALDEGADDYQRRFIDSFNGTVSPEMQGLRLGMSAMSKNNFDSTQAIKTGANIIMRTSMKQPLIKNMGVLIIPETAKRVDWDKQYGKAIPHEEIIIENEKP